MKSQPLRTWLKVLILLMFVFLLKGFPYEDTWGADIQDSPADAMLIVGDYTLPPTSTSSTARVTYAPCESGVMHGGKNGCLTAHALQLAYKILGLAFLQ